MEYVQQLPVGKSIIVLVNRILGHYVIGDMLQDLVMIAERIYGHGLVYEMELDQMSLVMLQNHTVVMVSSVLEQDTLEQNNVI